MDIASIPGDASTVYCSAMSARLMLREEWASLVAPEGRGLGYIGREALSARVTI